MRHPKKSDGVLRQEIELKWRFIAAQSAQYPILILCQLLEVSRSGFYAWKHRQKHPKERMIRDWEHLAIV